MNFEGTFFVGVIGHNGSGKTTMLEILMGIQTATSGTVDYSNEFELKDMKENIGVILQSNAFIAIMKVIELCVFLRATTRILLR